MKLPSRFARLIRELRRRRVLQAAAVYATGAFVAVQIAAAVFPALPLPAWAHTLVVVAALAGFPVVVALWWAFEITPEGIQRTIEREEAAPVLHARGTPWVALVLVGVVSVASAGLGWAAWNVWLDPGREARAAADEGAAEEELPLTRVAVLPFRAATDEMETVARALSRDLFHELNQVGALDLVSDRGTDPFASSELSPDRIARELRAGSLVTGTVEGIGDSVQVRVQLVDGRNGQSLMSREFTEPGDSMLVLRDELVAEAVRQLRRRLGQTIEVQRSRAGTGDATAWELFHRAEDRVQEGDSLRHAGAMELASELYRAADSLYRGARAEDRDWLEPRVARGWLAYRRARLGGATIESTDPGWLRAGVEIADGILADHPGDPAALELRGVLFSWLAQAADVDTTEALRKRAESDLRAAVTADPDRARAWAELADVVRAQGDFREAETYWHQARQADAFLSNDGDVLRLGAHLALELGQPETALDWAAQGQRRYPRSATYPQVRLLAYPMEGTPRVPADSIWAVLDEFERRVGGPQPYARIWVAAALARLGLADSARSVLARARQDDRFASYVAYYEPKVWLNLGDTARALELLRDAVERHDWDRNYVAEDSWWSGLHGDSAFRALVEEGS